MRMGRLAISRGFPSSETPDEPPPLALVASTEPPSPSLPADPLAAVQARLDALERLTRLCEAGALTVDEFLAEKAAILGHPPSNLAAPRAENGLPISFSPAAPRRPVRGRSLLGRLGWTILPLGLIGGAGLTALSQPEATLRLGGGAADFRLLTPGEIVTPPIPWNPRKHP
jgi:hypothetical protein